MGTRLKSDDDKPRRAGCPLLTLILLVGALLLIGTLRRN